MIRKESKFLQVSPPDSVRVSQEHGYAMGLLLSINTLKLSVLRRQKMALKQNFYLIYRQQEIHST